MRAEGVRTWKLGAGSPASLRWPLGGESSGVIHGLSPCKARTCDVPMNQERLIQGLDSRLTSNAVSVSHDISMT